MMVPGLLAAPILLLAAAAPPLALAPCRVPGVEREVLCGRLEVPERRDLAASRRISLSVVVLPATGPGPAPDPVYVLSGGPGQAATRGADRALVEHGATLKQRAVVLVDQRGTGGSHRLACQWHPEGDMRRYLSGGYDLEKVRACRDELAAKADLTAYTTRDFVRDLEDVRAALGHERVNLDAGSYGTRVALDYMKLFPGRVRSAVLRAVSPPDYRNPLPFARAGQEALDALFAACRKDAACNKAYPELPAEFAKVLARLDKGPVTVEIKNPATGAVQKAEIGREVFVTRIHLLLFASRLAARLPSFVHQAAQGDFVPFAQMAATFGHYIVDQLDVGMQLSVICAEDASRIAERDIEEASAGSFLGPRRPREVLKACALWPKRPLPADFLNPLRSEVPALIVSGTNDPVTPPRFGEQAARGLSRARHVVVAEGSHVDGAECLDALVARFIAAGSADGLDASCVAAIKRPPFVIGE
jgi:pimeloyl-ACP methyl ester carboxylesterase